jgi:hypothetical protein
MMPDEPRKIEQEPIPAELEAALPPIPDVEGAAMPDTPPSRPHCDLCGQSMEGEHPRAKAHKTCRQQERLEIARKHYEEHKNDEKKDIYGLPALVYEEGKTVDINAFVFRIYHVLKHDMGFGKNGVRQAITWIENGNPEGDVVDLLMEIEQALKDLPFGDVATNRVEIANALKTMWGQDVSLMWRKW